MINNRKASIVIVMAIPAVMVIFAVLFMLIGFANNIRIPCLTMINAAGHFKETQWRAILEAVINITVSLLLIKPLSEDWSEIADRTINMLEKIIENEAVHAMLAVLTDKQRDLIHQQFVLGKTHQEIADDMGISRVHSKTQTKITRH